MTSAQVATLNYWKRRYPRLYAQAYRQANVHAHTGLGQADTTSSGTSTFDSIMGGLSGLLTSYGQYRIASDVVNSQTSARQNILSLPGSGVGSTTNWLMIGGVALVAIVGIAVFLKKRKK